MNYTPQYIASLKTMMNDVLETVVSVFEQAGVALPTRRYTAFGPTAHDCEQVTVSFQQLYLGPPGDEASTPQKCDSPRTAVLLIEIVRCVPTMTRTSAPSQLDLQTYADSRAIDAWMLMEAGMQASPDWLGVLADVAPGEPSGAYQAVSMNLIAAVP